MQFNFNKQTYNIKFWKPSDGVLGRFVAVDTETTIAPFTTTPDLVTMQAYGGGQDVYYIPKKYIYEFTVIHKDSYWLLHNAAFDYDVICKYLNMDLWALYDDARIRDTAILYRLLHLAAFGSIPYKFSLALLTKKFLGVELTKDETRENFGQFLDSELSEIPREFLEYGAKDVVATYRVYFSMIPEIQRHDKMRTLLSHDIQAKGALALSHIYKNGIGFDLEKRDEWLHSVNLEMEKHANVLASWGWVRGKKGIKDVFERIVDMLGIKDQLPRTESGVISSKSEDLEPFRKFDFINSYLTYQTLEKATTFCRDLHVGRVHPRYNLIVNTGRTSCSSPNFQQLPRIGGIREMFIPEKGNKFLITDYSAIELSTLAQVCYNRYGYSEMRDRINNNEDLHKYYASVMNGITAEEVTKQQRQEAKAANFGFPGGLGTQTFIQFSSGYGLELTESQASEMKQVWFDAFPEMKSYMENEVGHVFTETGRKRGDTTYCAEKNTPFQGLAADGAKLALYNLDKAGYRVVGFVHDEIITEVKESEVEEKLALQEQIMIASMEQVVKDVRISVESTVSDHYTK
jgi:DNA polymerase-1